jgi:hypothetical protein
MKGILNLLAKAKLIELSEDEHLAAASELPPAALAAKVETLAERPNHPEARVSPNAAPPPRELPSLADACQDQDVQALADHVEEGHAFEDIFAAAGVPVSPYPAEKLLRLLDGLRAMDAGTRKAAVLAMDAADDNWQMVDCLRDAELKIAALEDHKQQLTVQMQNREQQSAEVVNQIKRTLDDATAAIRKQIAELEQLLEREVTRAAQETTSVEAGLRAARESAARETRRMDAEIERLREIPTTFKAPGAAH